MIPPVTTLRRGTRATYPTPSGRHVEYPPHIHHAASSLQFGDGSRQYGKNPEQFDTAVYGQYRKTYGGQNAQYSATTLRRTSEDGKRRVSFEDDHVNAARKARQRPRSANITSQREVIHVFPFSEKHDERLHRGAESQQDPYARGTAGRSGHRTVQRPRSVTIALQSESVNSSVTEQQRMQWTETAKRSQYSARPPDQSGYSRAGYHLNQAPQQSSYRSDKPSHSGNTTAQDAAYSGDHRAGSASHGAGHSNTNRQQARALHNAYEQMNPVDYSKTSGSNTQNAYAPAPESPEYVTMSRPHAPGAVDYNPQGVIQQRTTYRAGNDQLTAAQRGYEQMAPLYLNPPVPHSAAAGFQQHEVPYSAAGTQQNGIPYSAAGTQQNGIPYSAAGTQQNGIPYSAAGTQQNGMPYSAAGTQQNGHRMGMPSSAAGTQQNGTPYRVSTTQQNGTPYRAVPSQHTGTPYGSTASSPDGMPHSATRTHQNGTPRNAAGTQRSVIPYGTATSQQNGIPYSTATSQWNRTQYDAAGTQQNGTPYSAATTKQNRPPYSTQQNGMPYSTAASQWNGTPYSTIPGAIPQHCMSYSTAPSQQNGTSYSVAATQQNVAYSATHHQGGSPQSYSSTPQQNGYDGHNGDHAAPQQNGYDGYDSSSDSEFDDADDHYDYVNLRQWHDAENGSNSSTNQDDR